MAAKCALLLPLLLLLARAAAAAGAPYHPDDLRALRAFAGNLTGAGAAALRVVVVLITRRCVLRLGRRGLRRRRPRRAPAPPHP